VVVNASKNLLVFVSVWCLVNYVHKKFLFYAVCEDKSLLACSSALNAGKEYLIHFLFSFYQEIKVFFLCFAVLVAATPAVKVCKCEDKKVKKLRPLRFS